MSRAGVNVLLVSPQVERHRALQQRIELEQQALFGAPGAPGPPAGPAPAPAAEGLSQMAFFSPAGAHQGYPEGAQNPGATLASALRPRTSAEHSMGHAESRSRFLGPAKLPDPLAPAARPLPHPEGQACRFGHEPSCSSPCSPSPCLPGEPGSLLKRKTRDADETGAGTPLSSHSDDVTTSATPAVLDNSCSGPTQAPPTATSPQVKVSPQSQPRAETCQVTWLTVIFTVSSEGASGGRSL